MFSAFELSFLYFSEVELDCKRRHGLNQEVHFQIFYKETTHNIFHELIIIIIIIIIIITTTTTTTTTTTATTTTTTTTTTAIVINII